VLQCRRWKSTRNSLQHYRRRTPEQTQLYRVVYHGRDELFRVWEERFQETYGVLRDEVLTTFDEYLNCGLLAHGAARVYCDTCKHSLLVAFSCKKRGLCPSCGAKRAVKFGEHLYDSVLEKVPHRHCGFTLPKSDFAQASSGHCPSRGGPRRRFIEGGRLRVYFRYDRSLNNILFQAAATAVHSVLGSDTQSTGLVLTVQTAGEALNFNLDFAKASSEQAPYEDPAVALAKADSPAWAPRRRNIRRRWKVHTPCSHRHGCTFPTF